MQILLVKNKRFTAVDRANSASYEQLLNRLQQTVAWNEILTKNPAPEGNSLYAIGMQEISDSFSKICERLQVQGPSWISATGNTSAWKLMHRIDEAFVETEPVEAVIHNALHDEMSLQDSTLTNRDDLLNKLRIAVKMLAQEATLYLNQQPPQVPQDGQTKLPDLHAKPSAMQNTVNLEGKNVANILIAAAFGLTPSLLTSAIQKEADQYKTDLKSTAATAPTKEKQKCASSAFFTESAVCHLWAANRILHLLAQREGL